MTIRPLSSASLSPAVSAETNLAARLPARSPSGDVLLHGRVALLCDSLESIPAIRSETVTLGRKLAADPDYPGSLILKRLATMFVTDALS